MLGVGYFLFIQSIEQSGHLKKSRYDFFLKKRFLARYSARTNKPNDSGHFAKLETSLIHFETFFEL